jgi:hypothetical protein
MRAVLAALVVLSCAAFVRYHVLGDEPAAILEWHGHLCRVARETRVGEAMREVACRDGRVYDIEAEPVCVASALCMVVRAACFAVYEKG